MESSSESKLSGSDSTFSDQVRLLDTTLREGSYVVDFAFSAGDTKLITSRLDFAGVPFIEVGHGLGLGAFRQSGKPHLEEKHLLAANEATKASSWGAFFIPGVGEKADIESASRLGMDFVRIGVEPSRAQDALEYISFAKDLGLFVFANLMKTQSASVGAIGSLARIFEDTGADALCIVDSAGGMLPSTVSAYVSAARQNSSIEVGFHGHNNLGLANANSLAAIESGASIIDTSLRGIGRSAGNAVTEQLTLLLERYGRSLGLDTVALLETASILVDPILHSRSHLDSTQIASGYSEIHSSFVDRICEFALSRQLNHLELLLLLQGKAMERVLDQDLAAAALLLKDSHHKSRATEWDPPIAHSHDVRGSSSDSLASQAKTMAAKAVEVAKKRAGLSAFNLVQGIRDGAKSFVSTVVNESGPNAIASAEVYSYEDAVEIATEIKDTVDIILLDIDKKTDFSTRLSSLTNSGFSGVVLYSDLNAWTDAIIQRILAFPLGDTLLPSICLHGEGALRRSLEHKLAIFGRQTERPQPRVLVICGPEEVNLDFVSSFEFVVDGWLGSTNFSDVELCNSNTRIARPEMHRSIQSYLMLERDRPTHAQELIILPSGAKMVPSGSGVVAAKGDVIVDFDNLPPRVIGVADGSGRIRQDLNDEELAAAISLARKSVIRLKFGGVSEFE